MFKYIMIGVMALTLASCGQPKVIDGVKYGQYGVFNENQMKNPNIDYQIEPGCVILSIFLFETLVVPVVCVGWYLYEPVGKSEGVKTKGQVL